MSHQDVAAIWSTLQGRSDIDNILQECIGYYSLKASRFSWNRKQLRANAFTYFVSIRVIFDLQRTYLQSPELSQESKASLVQADLLVSTIFHLLEVQFLTFLAADALQDHEAYLSFAAKTLLSGLRTAHLRGIQLSAEQHEILIARFDEVWNREMLRETDHFIVNFLCRRTISELGRSTASSIYSKPACGVISLPDFYHGLYPVEDQKNAVVEAVRNTLDSSSDSADWLDCSLFLYDTFWSMQAALIQLCMDVQNAKTSQWSFSEQAILLNNLNSILTPRLKLLDKVYQDPPYKRISGSFDWALEQTKVIISQELHPVCTGHSCSCFGNERANIQDLWLRSGGHHILSNMNKYMAPTQHLDIGTILKDFRLQVDTRNATLPNLSKELKHLSRKIANDAHQFSSGSTVRTTDLNKYGQPAEIFVLDCPQLHAISGKYITEKIPSKSMAKAKEDALGSVRSHIGCYRQSPSLAIM
ncbi:hypothetical protein BGZ60DRAFT_19211 [Tricladium varicosporioides]|nr:hypothetical protein BGZ60DRAFT_19211 [Hymenoscyphus varicosporioides]